MSIADITQPQPFVSRRRGDIGDLTCYRSGRPLMTFQIEMIEEERYNSAWRRRKLCERIDNWFGVVAFFTVFLPFLYYFHHLHFPVLFVVFSSIVIGVGSTAGVMHARLRCPRCNQLFSVRPPRERHIYYLPYCAHCGLPEGAKPGPSVDPRFVGSKSN